VFVAYGPRWQQDVVGCCVPPLAHVATIHAHYSAARRPCHLHVFRSPTSPTVTLPPGYVRGLADVRGHHRAAYAIAPFVTSGGILVDPCCGEGDAALAALRAGMIFYGNELHPGRAATTIALLRTGGA